MATFLEELLASVLDMPGKFASVAAHDPLAAVMLAVGATVMAVTIGAGLYLVAGTLLNELTSVPRGPAHR